MRKRRRNGKEGGAKNIKIAKKRKNEIRKEGGRQKEKREGSEYSDEENKRKLIENRERKREK